MKNITSFIFAAIIAVQAFAAGEKKLNVVATLPVLADIARKVGGDAVDVKSLAQPNQDPHFISPTPPLRNITGAADVFIENGLSLELWAQKLVDASGNTKIEVGQPGRIVASKGIATLEVPSAMSRAGGDIHPGGNPHVWLDPVNAKVIARNISEGFSKIDPARKATYEAGLKKFETDIDTRLPGWMKKAEVLKGKEAITYHKSFVYFATRFGFKIATEIEDKPGVKPSADHQRELLEVIKNDKIKVLAIELFYPRTEADWLANRTEAKVVRVPIDVGADDDAKDYFSLIDLLLARFGQYYQ